VSACLQITATYPPDISGVGDYAALLVRAFESSGRPVQTLVARPEVWTGEDAIPLVRADANDLAAALRKTDRVLLHFSGYGYARRGLCRWLVDGLARWKAAGPSRRLVTMFHEVYATGPIWRSSFWTSIPQERIARDLARLSDFCFVSSIGGQLQLQRLAPDLGVAVLPVFSNIGEPQATGLLCERKNVSVVFGGVNQRRRVYQALSSSADAVSRQLEQHGVTGIVDIGPVADVPARIGGLEVARLGPLPTHEVSNMLAIARIGLVDYPGHVFTKSGIAAAYFAHRLLVVNTSPLGGFPPDLRDGTQFVGLNAFLSGRLPAQQIADAGHAWYRQHGVAKTAQMFQALLV